MRDGFDFEDDLDDLKDEDHNESSYFPPVKNTKSKQNLSSSIDKSSTSKVENKGSTLPQSIKTNKFNDNFKKSRNDSEDEYGFNNIKANPKAQFPELNQTPAPAPNKNNTILSLSK